MASFHLPSFYAPWVTWADLCGKFLRYSDKLLWNMDAIKRIGALHDFVNSELAEAWEQVTVKPRVEVISTRAGGYGRGHHFAQEAIYKTVYLGKVVHSYLTVDVQQSHVVCLIREWVAGGDSGLVDHKMLVTWADVEQWANEHKAEKVGVDLGYAVRASEVKRYCGEYKGIPMLGVDKMRGMKWTKFDPLEGTGRQGTLGDDFWMLQFNPNGLKDRLWQMIEAKAGMEWYTYDVVDHDYAVQMTSEQSVDGKWKLIKSHGQNHYWDCEVMQIAMARAYEILPDYSIEVEQ
jgi:hypothetical protein